MAGGLSKVVRHSNPGVGRAYQQENVDSGESGSGGAGGGSMKAVAFPGEAQHGG